MPNKRNKDFLIQRIRSLLSYDPHTGLFYWRSPQPGRDPDTPAGSIRADGTRRIMVKGRLYQAHRLAWYYVKGTLPPRPLIHINGDKDDNRIANLRLQTILDCRNRQLQSKCAKVGE